PEEVSFPHYSARYKSDIRALGEAVSALREAKRPVIIAGGGTIISGAAAQIFEIATTENIPVATSLMGKGIFPEDHTLSLGMLGMHGTAQANLAVSAADLILAIGTRFSDRLTGNRDHFAPRAKVIHIDIDSAEIGKNIRADIPLKGDCSEILSKLIEALPKESPLGHRKWLAEIERVRSSNPDEQTGGKELRPVGIIRSLRSRVNREDILTTEVGQHQMWAALHWKTSVPGTFITSGGLGTMGYGLPAAIGAAFARPGRPVTCLSGDGSFLMNVQELETCVRYNLPVRLIVLNNGSLGMVRQWQDIFWGKRFIHTCQKPACSLSKVAESFGFRAWTAETPLELEEALDGAFAADGPSFVECFISCEENVYPMVPAGGRLDQFLDPQRQEKPAIRI
ncbi:MAG: thiamine pyrophosphate-dependent enzyme, partial [Thermovirgaceae bacterium]|nr:thiamine pyrophosphate-dependent enzyme [Thermovirgaceae bacterium]